MNKTISINLAGRVFNIEDDAFITLKEYLDKIKMNFMNDSAASEIMDDIEDRIAELFQERTNERKNVITSEDVMQVIAIMGKPEDYVTEDSFDNKASGQANAGSNVRNSKRRIYRDADDSILGGVCSGLSHYLGWDPLIIRLLMVVLAFASFGTAIFGYILFWALVPAAITTAEKLQMRGEPVNIDNIGRFVNEEARAAADRVGKFGKNVGDSARKFSHSFARGIGRVIAVIFGLFCLLCGLTLLISLIASLGFSEFQFFGFDGSNWDMLDSIVFGNDGTLWVLVIGFVLVILAPAMALIYTSIKILTRSQRRIRGFSLSLAVLFFVGIIMCVYGGVHTSKQFIHHGRIVEELSLNDIHTDTLIIDGMNDDVFIGRTDFNEEFFNLVKKQDGRIYYGLPLDYRVVASVDNQYRIELDKRSNGRNPSMAGDFANAITYNYEASMNRLALSPYFSTPDNHTYRAQHIAVKIHVPVGKYVVLTKKTETVLDFADSDEVDRVLIMTKDGLSKDVDKHSNKRAPRSLPQGVIQ
jgi:phage shock protein PspC (stress-responsive transcriptional regulator)